MAECSICKKSSSLISRYLPVCLNCIRNNFSKAKPIIEKVHTKARCNFDLPVTEPKTPGGISCTLCIHQCQMGEGETSWCGLRKNIGGKLTGVTPDKALLCWYHDPLPTNCVADWVCPGGTECGYPEYSYRKGPEHGYKNLAVFYLGCSFDCLFCQNWHHKEFSIGRDRFITAEELASAVDNYTSCICYFGGDPTPQLVHSIKTTEQALNKNQNRILRMCWETNGSMNPKLLDRIVDIALKSGGCIKFDLKTYSEELNIALCGVSNKQTLENFTRVAKSLKERPAVPLLVASTLLLPGYIDKHEVEQIAKFIASLDPSIPYSLLAFAPCFYMSDLPTTSRNQAEKCYRIAKEVGLERVRIGNIHLLS